MHNCSVLAIVNRKGGSGKTTTAVNLAAEWAKLNYSTLLIDLDTQGHAAIGLGCSVKGNNNTVHDIFRKDNHDAIFKELHDTSVNNISILPADTSYISEDINPNFLRNFLDQNEVKEKYQRIILDTPPSLDGLLINALAAADFVVIPFIPHYLASVGVQQLAKLFYQIAMSHNTDLKLLGLLPIMYDSHITLHKRVVSELTKKFGLNRMLRGIRTNIKLAESFEAGVPINEYAPRCQGSMDYHLLAEELETLMN